jgi:hypothetical protein
VPVLNSHVGCTTLNDGAEGPTGLASTTTVVTELIHPFTFFTLTPYTPGITPLNTPPLFKYVEPSILYVFPDTNGDVTLITPVPISHVG